MPTHASEATSPSPENEPRAAGRVPIRTLCDILTRLEREHRKLGLLRYKEDGKWTGISTDDFVSTVRALTLGLSGLGVKKGDRVALLSENRPEWAAFDHAILNLGAVNVPLYPSLTTPQARFILEHSEAKVLVVSTDLQLAKGLSCLIDLPTLETLVMMDSRDDYPPATLPWTALLREGEAAHQANPGHFQALRSAVGPDDLASILYTSGTTGEPKGVMLTHGNFASNVNSTLAVIPFRTTDVAISFLPLSHALERIVEFVYLTEGATIAYAESVEAVPQNLLEIQPTVLITVPRLLEKAHARIMEGVRKAPWLRRMMFAAAYAVGRQRIRALQESRPVPRLTAPFQGLAERWVFSRIQERVFGPRLRFIISGGAPLAPEIGEFFHALGIPVLEGYGLTETSPVITLNALERNRIGTVGPLIPGVEVRIAEDGEVLTRGPNVMIGYYRDPAATQATLEGGWLHTGDIGQLDGDGFLRITDRKKELIKTSGGKLVAPQPIENRLKTEPGISQAVLVGDRRNFVAALLVPDFEWLRSYAQQSGISAQAPAELIAEARVIEHYRGIVARIMEEFAPYERVKRFRLLPRELSQQEGELTPTLKLKRRIIEEKYGDLIASMYDE